MVVAFFFTESERLIEQQKLLKKTVRISEQISQEQSQNEFCTVNSKPLMAILFIRNYKRGKNVHNFENFNILA